MTDPRLVYGNAIHRRPESLVEQAIYRFPLFIRSHRKKRRSKSLHRSWPENELVPSANVAPES
jgi:hypothetical protein